MSDLVDQHIEKTITETVLYLCRMYGNDRVHATVIGCAVGLSYRYLGPQATVLVINTMLEELNRNPQNTVN